MQPFVALAQGMQAAGRSVAVAAADDFEPLVRSAGLVFEPLGFSMQNLMGDPAVRRWLTGSSHSLRVELRHMSEVVRVFQRPAVAALLGLLDKYDAFVSGLLTADALASVVQALGKRHAIALLAPGLPTRVAAAQLFPVVRRTSRLNLVTSTLGSYGTLRLGSPIRRAVEHELGLPHRGVREQLRLLSQTPTLLGASPHVIPRAPDWDEHVALTGYWTLPVGDWSPPPVLVDFLPTGPVHIGLGSMPVTEPDAFVALLDTALARLGLTATVQGSWVGATPGGDRLLPLGDVPHPWLFPRVRAVVHHGGAGTTGAAFGSGRPQLAIPHIGDQPYWGRRVVDLGCGPAPLRLHELTADALTARLVGLVSGSFDARAAAVGEQVRSEDGVGVAVAHLERWWGRGS